MGGGAATSIRKSADFILQRSLDPDRDVQVINVFQPDNDNVYRHVAVLRASHGDSLGDFAISGRRVLAQCGEAVCEFELPASLTVPLTRQHTFTLAADDFTTSAGSQFAVVTGAAGRVYRQSNTTLGLTHAAVFSSTHWTNQSMQADIRPLAFNGNDRWVGLATRYRDAANYYYVTLRGSGSVQLKRMVNGAFSTIASAPITVNTNRTYRLRLESTGSNHRVFVDERLVLDADDDSLKLGRAALLTYGAQADFDNVFASPSPLTTLRADGTLNPAVPNSTGARRPVDSGAPWIATATACSRRPRWTAKLARSPACRPATRHWTSVCDPTPSPPAAAPRIAGWERSCVIGTR